MMTEKPKIQYIGQFYVPGSEAQVLAPKKKKKKAKTKLPIAKQEQVKAIYIDPVALIGITVAVVMLAAGILGGRELWLYEHPEIQIRFSHDRSEDLYRSYPICSIRSRSHIGQGYAKQYGEELRQYWEATNEVFVWISEQYRKPLYVTSDVTIGDGKTVILFRGTGTSMTTGETEEIHRDCVLDFEMHAEVLRSEEEPELTVSD